MGAKRVIEIFMAFEVETPPLCISMPGGDREHDINTEHQAPDTSILPAVLRGLDVSKVETRTDFVRELNRTLPLNEYNLPIYIYNPAFLDVGLVTSTDRANAKTLLADMLTNSITYLDYDHGFPTLKGDSPFWSLLPWESRSAFAAFLQFLELPGARGIHKIDSIEPELLREWFHENMWNFRALAYDVYRAAHHARLREQRIFSVSENQFAKSEALLETVTKAIMNKPQEHWDSIDADRLIAAFSRLADTQQRALAIGNKEGTPVNSSVEVIMRKAAEGQGHTRKVDNSLVDMEALLSDPQALDAAQELIIKVNQR